MNEPRFYQQDSATILAFNEASAKLQADLTAHKAEIDAVLDRNSRYAAMLGLQGTPGMLIGPYLIPGGMDLRGLREAVALARRDPNGTASQ